ncbi:glycosyltransferase family 4 protein [Chitinophaga sp. 212800010-3]|uniref:glycosyltransferase family 4 protein n=1 Tax=unclassified Chitinophaga TaxID=2619133 RepID=UPI002DE8A382|nr:Glycosyltransferase WbuB [Chitinophaga sp. 212800010-3]
MRILILSQWCYPEPDLKALTFARVLAGRGHTVQVLTGFPNYPGGKVYKGYSIKLFSREIIDNLEVLRCALYPSHDRSGLKRIFNYLSFAFFASLIGIFRTRKADILYVYHPPATVAIPAILIKLFRKVPVVYDIQDIWPDTLKVTGMVNNKYVLKAVDIFMKMCYRSVDHVVVLSNGFRELLIARGVRSSKVNVIYNWSNPIGLAGEVDREIISLFKNRFTILFAGTIGLAQGLDVVVKCAEQLREIKENDMQFILLGGGVDVNRLKSQVMEKGLQNIHFIDRVPASIIGSYLSCADVLLIHLLEDRLFEITVPCKTQAYLLAGKPILAGVKGDAAALIENAQAGLVFIPEDHNDLLEKALILKSMGPVTLRQFGNNGRRFYDNQLSIEKGVEKFEKIFEVVQHKR